MLWQDPLVACVEWGWGGEQVAKEDIMRPRSPGGCSEGHRSVCHRWQSLILLLSSLPKLSQVAAFLFPEPRTSFRALDGLSAQTALPSGPTTSTRTALSPPSTVAPGTSGVLLMLGASVWVLVAQGTHFVEMNSVLHLCFGHWYLKKSKNIKMKPSYLLPPPRSLHQATPP